MGWVDPLGLTNIPGECPPPKTAEADPIQPDRQGGPEEPPSVAGNAGRAGKQARLRELANDDKLGSSDRGWLLQEMNSIDRGQRNSIRNPPGKDLAHERGREAAKGYGYSFSNLQLRILHRLQHKYDNFGRKNKERPVENKNED
ncbi:hypothetical protein CUC53_16955 [Aeromonas cavernicola]|uniref:Bacterial toxin 8 domain-containing protein n=1 Tax=Aeromonas cavernicola TaxID=1006623 RepID=A0A2H9U0Q5_9GAMM|nr:hypothetical protein CUC53_16955 [Aeromonas cavernicola]